MMIRTRGRRLVSRLEALERIYDTRGPRVFRVIFEYGGEPTIVTIYRDENRTEIIEPPPPDDDPDEFLPGASEGIGAEHVSPAPPFDETGRDPYSEPRTEAAVKALGTHGSVASPSSPEGARDSSPGRAALDRKSHNLATPAGAQDNQMPCHAVGTYVGRRPRNPTNRAANACERARPQSERSYLRATTEEALFRRDLPALSWRKRSCLPGRPSCRLLRRGTLHRIEQSRAARRLGPLRRLRRRLTSLSIPSGAACRARSPAHNQDAPPSSSRARLQAVQ